MDWYECIKAKGGLDHLEANRFRHCVHEGVCSCHKQYRKKVRTFKNITKLLKWGVDLSKETYSSVYFVNNHYISLLSLKVREKGERDWEKKTDSKLKKTLLQS